MPSAARVVGNPPRLDALLDLVATTQVLIFLAEGHLSTQAVRDVAQVAASGGEMSLQDVSVQFALVAGADGRDEIRKVVFRAFFFDFVCTSGSPWVLPLG